MSFSFPAKIKGLAVVAMAVGAFACLFALPAQAQSAAPVQTYVDQATPPAVSDNGPGVPVSPGEITMQDVLKAHEIQKKSDFQLQPPTASNAPAPPPVITPGMGASSANVMLMQGLQSALQEPGKSNKPALLKAPTLNSAGTATAAPVALSQPTPVNVSVAPTPGVKYEAGQEPKSLGGDTPQPASAMPENISTATEVPAAIVSTSASAPETSSGDCEPHVRAWTKTCAQAGYAASFTGHVTGETRTVCPAGTMQDVWLSNTCAGSQGAESADANVAAVTSDVPVTGDGNTPDAQAQTMSSATSRADGSCGPANGLAANMIPASGELCAAGIATEIVGTGPWRWTCRGVSGGMTVSCAAPVSMAPVKTAKSKADPLPPTAYLSAPDGDVPVPPEAPAQPAQALAIEVEDGQCGSADGVGTDQSPSGNLCAHGVASRVSGYGPWNWACSGMNGGQAVSCTAPTRIDGQCGAASGAPADEMPTRDLCNAGYASAITGSGPWNWTCGGMNGGSAVTCSAAPKQDAVCGTASLGGHRQTPQDELCSVGTPSSVSGNGPWNWSCSGSNGGSAVSCTAPISVNGVCGPANGVAASEAPSEDLCNHGRATRVVGVGPWSWSCAGTDGGDTQSCTAPMQAAARHTASSNSSSSVAPSPQAAPTSAVTTSASNACGPASELAALEAPDKDLCNHGKASSVSGDGPWTWTCDEGGQLTACSTLSMTGELPDATASAPAADSNEAPTPKAAPAAAVAPTPPSDNQAACGAAAEQSVTEIPSVQLCAVGKASAVHGSGPWNWTCTKGKTKAACSAARIVDAACGPTNGSVQRNAPSYGLCSAGTATDIQGTGPWLWSCVGSGGGVSVSCSAMSQAQTRVDGACGSAGNAVATTTPAANLCDSGVASKVYGDGPWTWTCGGLNGGSAASCSAQRNIAAAPLPPGPAVNGLCGASNGVAMNSQPSDDFCTSGTATAVSGNGPWNWNCIGENGGMTVSCTAPLQPPAPIVGVCGAASGVPTLTTPRSGLCSAGISSAVNGKGPWTWSCSGTNGGGAVGCVAPLAGGGGRVGSLPSMTTPSSGDAPAPQAAPASAVSNGVLVTPRLPSGTLPPLEKGAMPPLEKGAMPHLQPSKAFDSPPEASALPPVPAPGELDTPAAEPDLPSDAHDVPPPPIRDTLKSSAALKPPAIDAQGDSIPGNHFVLDSDISTIPFAHLAENMGNDVLPTVDKLAAVMRSHMGLRITLTAYADSSGNVSPRDARRLSLTRALVVRDYLTAKGIASGRIDVRALGVNYTGDNGDRVDVVAN